MCVKQKSFQYGRAIDEYKQQRISPYKTDAVACLVSTFVRQYNGGMPESNRDSRVNFILDMSHTRFINMINVNFIFMNRILPYYNTVYSACCGHRLT